MAFEHKEGKGSVFKSDKDNIALSGEFKLNGKVCWLTIWKQDEGKKHWNVSVKEKPGQDAPRSDDDYGPGGTVDLDDSIPFAPETR